MSWSSSKLEWWAFGPTKNSFENLLLNTRKNQNFCSSKTSSSMWLRSINWRMRRLLKYLTLSHGLSNSISSGRSDLKNVNRQRKAHARVWFSDAALVLVGKTRVWRPPRLKSLIRSFKILDASMANSASRSLRRGFIMSASGVHNFRKF